jgi:hypothetical protein
VRVYQFRHIRETMASEDIARHGGQPQAPQAVLRRRRSLAGAPGTGSGCFASLDRANCAPLSSRGLGRRPLMAETRVRIPVAVLGCSPRCRRRHGLALDPSVSAWSILGPICLCELGTTPFTSAAEGFRSRWKGAASQRRVPSFVSRPEGLRATWAETLASVKSRSEPDAPAPRVPFVQSGSAAAAPTDACLPRQSASDGEAR